ncbi:MAG: glycoside hydrolase family 9 protein [Defluviitaleaceae bacterium]|nr:glycoside hydrolase family 9 protein [Defluviitaleaceae bacterium]MCL2262370.1 glycoside hydrolase family 9 protein [Defluviitaleaceae bacterium]
MKKIHVNQLGYFADDVKKAVCETDAGAFEIIRTSDGAAVFSGKTGAAVHDAASAQDVRVADFSEFSQQGEFFVSAGGQESYPFTIGADAYAGLNAALLDAFNYQKCGVAIDKGIWSHPPCHTSPAVIYGTKETRDVSGGWHDAGDYGRYIVPAAMAVADLLLAYDLCANPLQEILDVTWFEIEWMLKMQCEKTGGVYHKVSCASFNALDEAPQNERGELILCPISLTATADFAATMALASRFYPDKKAALLAAAEHAWTWCEQNLDAPNFVNPEGVTTGQYGDITAKDEIFWAACELFSATGAEKYHDVIKQSEIYVGLGWANMGTYGITAYLSLKSSADAELSEKMKTRLRAVCEEIMQKHASEPFGTSLGVTYRWGSSLDVANNAMSLLLYSKLVEENAAYTNAAKEHIHYLLGRNPLSQSYVTGFGSLPAKDPHHRPSVAVGETFPGMVVGGPNPTTPRDVVLQTHCEGNPPSKFYVDHKESFASNEIAIYWNSSVYFLVAVLGM